MVVSFRLFAGTDDGLRDNNEDNFTVCPDLTTNEWMVPANQQETIPLGRYGSLMVVADGMGGMNAGEVASDIAIKTVQKMFTPDKLPKSGSINDIKTHIRKTIVEADCEIKKHCKKDPSTEGMGSTIVMAWLIGSKVFVGWMGDSRAYSYVPESGIKRLSKDHSYVQELVDAKMITEEEAMLHPQSNVIMRSLGDSNQKAKPDIVSHNVAKGEIILLCSDGLCGVCTDAEIAEVISQTSDDLRDCKESLTKCALDNDGSDNITIALMQIIDLPPQITKEKKASATTNNLLITWRSILLLVFGLAILFSLGVIGYKSSNSAIQENMLQDKQPDSNKFKNSGTNSITGRKEIIEELQIDTLDKREDFKGQLQNSVSNKVDKRKSNVLVESISSPKTTVDLEKELNPSKKGNATPIRLQKATDSLNNTKRK